MQIFLQNLSFDRHIEKIKNGVKIDYVSICSLITYMIPIFDGLRSGADVICEKPLVLNPWNVGTHRNRKRVCQ